MNSIRENLERIRAGIAVALKKSGRGIQPVVIAVTKTHPVEVLNELERCGVRDIGENYVQELAGKIEAWPGLNWHFIGGLQKNKVKYIVGRVVMIHSVDNLPLAAEIEKRAAARNVAQDVLIQLNQGEETKGGVPVAEAGTLAAALARFPHIRVRGLMAMPPYADDPELSRPYFREARELRDAINSRGILEQPMTELSMGMSGDYTVAVEEGATLLRIGTALLGERAYKKEQKETA